MVHGLQFCEGVSGCHFWNISSVLDNLHILFQILSATLKVDVISPILQMREQAQRGHEARC